MAQVTIYLPDGVALHARSAAKVQGTSLERSIAAQVTQKVKTTWPPEVLAALGSFLRFPG